MADDTLTKYLAEWGGHADELVWRTHASAIWEDGPRGGTWFPDGALSVYDNCVARHLPGLGDQPAIHWEGEPGERRTLTYHELADEAERLSQGLRRLGVNSGDRVGLHLGWIPETVVAILACARIGATYSILPTSLPVEALSLRLADFAPHILMTQDGAWRRGAILPLKARVDDALGAYDGVEHTLVVRRTGIDIAWYEGDVWYADVVDGPRDALESYAFGSQDPLFSVSLANRGGQPMSLLQQATTTMAVARRIHRDGICAGNILWVLGDASWLANQVHGIFGPLLWGETAVMYEGTIDVPDPERLWRILKHYEVTTILMPPSVGLALRDMGSPAPAKDQVKTLQRIVTIGDDPGDELADWLARAISKGKVQIADGWGQMELCGVVMIDLPPPRRQMPDVAPDVSPIIGDQTEGDQTDTEDVGELLLCRPWPGMSSAINGEHAAELNDAHWNTHPGAYATGDLARREADGTLRFLGRIDEVASVSGQLVSLNEIRKTLLEHPFVVAADAVSYRDPRHGTSVAAAVALDSSAPALDTESVRGQLSALLEDVLGGIARPRTVLILDHIGNDLTRVERRHALAMLAISSSSAVVAASWSQVRAAAQSSSLER
jgi:acetyl-CoA synthetase